MGRITSGIGLVSGINSGSIIDQLMALEARPKTLLQTRIDNTNKQKLAYTDLSARLTALRLSGTSLKKTTFFQKTNATSNNENVLTATTGTSAATGAFQFQVARLVTAQQSVSNAFASQNDKVGAGALTIEMGGGEINSQATLSQLNGGNGVRRGSFRVTDRSGRTGMIDISAAVSLDDVVRKINTSLDVSVKAELVGDQLKITDQTGQTTGNLTINDLGDGHAAADLGIAKSVAGPIAGDSINYLGRATLLSQLNDGGGLRTAGASPDLRITDSNGAAYDVTLSNIGTLGGVLDAINKATAGKVTASLAGNGKSLALTDSAGGGGTLAVAALNGSRVVRDLGLEATAAGNTLSGNNILASLNTVLLSSLRGGGGLSLGTVDFTDRSGAQARIDFAGAKTVQDVLDLINNNGAIHLNAALKDSANGIQLTDTSNGSGNLIIADNSSTTAAELGIPGTFDNATPLVKGTNLQRQWVSENTLLSNYNGGRGVSLGQFKITNANGGSATIDLGVGTVLTIGDVIKKINATTISGGGSLNVMASINANGDGLLLTDNTGGSVGKLKVEEAGGTTTTDLAIKGTATATTIDGTFERTLTIDATQSLSDVMDKINGPGFGISANIISDGSSMPYRLSLTSRQSGRNGRVSFDSGATSIQTRTLVESQDAAVFVGSASSSNPLLVTSSTNQLTGVVKGVTLDLHAVSSTPVTLSVSATAENVVTQLQSFVDNFNQLVDRMKELTKYDTKTSARGLLLGENTAQTVQQEMYAIVSSSVSGAGNYASLADLGVSATSTGGKLAFDADRFRTAFATSPDSVKKLFTLLDGSKKGIGGMMEDRINRLIDPINGVITLENKSLDDRTTQFQSRITDMDTRLASKRARLERQFTGLETVLAGLQSQQAALASLTGMTSSSKSSSK